MKYLNLLRQLCLHPLHLHHLNLQLYQLDNRNHLLHHHLHLLMDVFHKQIQNLKQFQLFLL